MRRIEPVFTCCKKLATSCLHSLEEVSCFDGVPFVVVAHSVGCWIAMEMISQARQLSKALPLHCFFSAMPAPSIAEHLRPWTPQSQLDDEGFKSECEKWSISSAVFAPDVWPMYRALLRGDFQLFDSYSLDDELVLPLSCPVDAFCGSLDLRVTKRMMEEWSDWTTAEFSLVEIAGANHLWPLNNKLAKEEWLGLIVQKIKGLTPTAE